MIDILAKIVMNVCIFGLVYCPFMLVRCKIVFRNRTKIIDAIYEYNKYRINHEDYENLISYECMEDHDETMLRLWDFGCERIVPEDVFCKIERFLK